MKETNVELFDGVSQMVTKKPLEPRQQRIGIYSGTFDPVHVGHVAFALQAIQAARLDKVYFLPEREPRRKQGVTHYAHRVAMLRRAARPHSKLEVLELTARHFTVLKTLPEIHRTVGTDITLVFLVGSDVAVNLRRWSHIDSLTRHAEFCVGMRSTDDEDDIRKALTPLALQGSQLHLVRSFASNVSSSEIRRAIRAKRWTYGLLQSVYGYSKQEWLYL